MCYSPGSSVLGIRFDDGVLLSADTLVTYGTLARYQNVNRVIRINDNVLLGGGGDFADIQSLVRTINQKVVDDYCLGDGLNIRPNALLNWVTRLLYSRRTLKDPLDMELVIGGLDANLQPFLSVVDARGTSQHSYVVACGFARLITVPLVRERKPRDRDFTLAEAANLVRDCMRILYYRDTRSISQYMVGICSKSECCIKGPFKAEENWEIAEHVTGY